MAEAARNYVREDDVDSALRSLGPGLSRTVLMSSLLFSEAERRTCTANDPGILKGMLGWGRCIRALREQLRELGWQREEPKSLPLIVSPDGRVAITVATGDEQVGNPTALFASTKYDKGNMLCDWVDPSRQIGLFDPEPEADVEDPPDLWILLVLRTKTHVLAELSRPTSVTKEQRIRFGGERIFMQPLPVDQTLVLDGEDDGEEPPTEVSVERL